MEHLDAFLRELESGEANLFPENFAQESNLAVQDGYTTSTLIRSPPKDAIRNLMENQRAERFDPVAQYLAKEYFDRTSGEKLKTPDGKEVITESLESFPLRCLALVWKMKTELPKSSAEDFAKKHGLDLTADQIRSLEWILFARLNYRMRILTALCFLNHFLTLLPASVEDRRRLKHIAARAFLFNNMQLEVSLETFKPSVIAATGLLLAFTGFFPDRETTLANRNRLFESPHVTQDEVVQCLNATLAFLDYNLLRRIAPKKPNHPALGGAMAAAQGNSNRPPLESSFQSDSSVAKGQRSESPHGYLGSRSEGGSASGSKIDDDDDDDSESHDSDSEDHDSADDLLKGFIAFFNKLGARLRGKDDRLYGDFLQAVQAHSTEIKRRDATGFLAEISHILRGHDDLIDELRRLLKMSPPPQPKQKPPVVEEEEALPCPEIPSSSSPSPSPSPLEKEGSNDASDNDD